MEKAITIGHVHLKVSDLGRSVAFYREAFGLELMQTFGESAAFLSWDGYHHHIGLNVWQSRGGPPPARNATGLFHVAFLYPNRRALAHALAHLLKIGVAIDGAADHGVSEAIYLHDPDGNGIEIYRDRPKDEWPLENGRLAMVTEPLDLEELLREIVAEQ
jgi:catechol 2,3-dioxygenase